MRNFAMNVGFHARVNRQIEISFCNRLTTRFWEEFSLDSRQISLGMRYNFFVYFKQVTRRIVSFFFKANVLDNLRQIPNQYLI